MHWAWGGRTYFDEILATGREPGLMRLRLADLHLHSACRQAGRPASSSVRNLARGNRRRTISQPPRNSSTIAVEDYPGLLPNADAVMFGS